MSSLPPGPRASAVVQTARWLLAPAEFMESCRRRFGDAFTVRFLGFERPMVIVSHPDTIRALYTENAHRLPPGRTLALRPIMGAQSLLLLEGEAHLERRRLMLPPFHGERMRAYEPAITRIARAEIDRWQPGAPLVLHPRMRAITFEVILRLVFGVTDDTRLERLRELLPRFLDRTASPALSFRVLLARRLGRPDPLERLAAAGGEIDDVLYAHIAARRAAGGDGDDVLSMLLAARFGDGSAMSDGELRDQLVTLLLAGHETTATALAWTFDLLAHDPAVLERLTTEVRGGDDTYLRAVIAESLRLRPVLPLAGRRLARELRAGPYALPPGTDVSPSIWLLHTREDLYPQPRAFRPERFLEGAAPAYGWIPFGGGVRRCIGAAFAELEMRVVLSEVLTALELAPATPRPETIARRNLTFAPRHGTRVIVTRREAPLALASTAR